MRVSHVTEVQPPLELYFPCVYRKTPPPFQDAIWNRKKPGNVGDSSARDPQERPTRIKPAGHAAAEVLSAENRPRRDQSRYRTSSHLPCAPNAVLSDVAATPQSE